MKTLLYEIYNPYHPDYKGPDKNSYGSPPEGSNDPLGCILLVTVIILLLVSALF